MTTLVKKFNWGYGIAFVYTAFALGMLFLVYMCTTYKVDLVQPDYYNQELAYQQRIDQKSNTAALTQHLEIAYNRNAETVHVRLPEELTGTQNMKLRFYRPDDSTLDKNLHQPVSTANDIVVSTNGMKAGLWRLEMSWTHGTKDYFQETILNL